MVLLIEEKEKVLSSLSKSYNFWLVGLFRDDQHQRIWDNGFSAESTSIPIESSVATFASGQYGYYVGNSKADLLKTRYGSTTHGKRKGVKFIIKVL